MKPQIWKNGNFKGGWYLKKYSETGKRMRIPRKHPVSSGYDPTSFNSLKTIVFLKIKIKYYVRILVLWITWAPSLLNVKSSLFDYHTSRSACSIRIQENRTLLIQERREGDRAPYICVLFLCSVIGWFWHDIGQHSNVQLNLCQRNWLKASHR